MGSRGPINLLQSSTVYDCNLNVIQRSAVDKGTLIAATRVLKRRFNYPAAGHGIRSVTKCSAKYGSWSLSLCNKSHSITAESAG